MTLGRMGRKSGTVASARQRRGGSRRIPRRKDSTLSARERRCLLQLVACGSIFVLLVAVKLLLPGKLTGVRERISKVLEQNMDVKAVFSAIGGAASGETAVEDTLDEVYQAVFHPQEAGQALETAVISRGGVRFSEQTAMDSLREFRLQQPAEEEPLSATQASKAQTAETEVSTLAYVLYSDQNLPENVSMEQAILGFDYCTPVFGTVSSGFGYREHPVEGEERFHYGLDIAADEGTAVECFADGTVKAVGESSSYGKYVIVSHQGGYDTLYAHCSKITVSSGTAVTEGQTIAKVGQTGIATGPHLHFELHRNGVYLNPVYYVCPA
ncbi:M23 family metallopeptidase [Dysosmobacter sp.]